MKKIEITGASHFTRRMFEACGRFQWAREFLRNALEAGANRVEFAIEWEAVENLGLYRRMIIDNGSGMSGDELRRFFSTLGAGAKKIGGLHDNFGVGAKIASLPWNPNGVVVISHSGGKAAMIWIYLDEDSGDYALMEFDVGGTKTCVIDPTDVDWSECIGNDDVDWSKVSPDWIRENGTAIVLLGSDDHPHTVLGNPDAQEDINKGLSIYLNTRFWEVGDAEVFVHELRTKTISSWPSGREDRDGTRRPNRRRIQGARHYLFEKDSTKGKLSANGTILVDQERVAVHWYLWEGARPQIHMYAREFGYVATKYRDELYEPDAGKIAFRKFGIIESEVQRALTLIIEPTHYDPGRSPWGVHPDQARTKLIFTGNGEKGSSLPMDDWGVEFADNLPAEVYAAIQAAREQMSGSIDDEEYRKRLQNKFGARWRIKRLISSVKSATEKVQNATETKTEVATIEPKIAGPGGRRRRRRGSITVGRKLATSGGNGLAVELDVAVDVPKWTTARADYFQKSWHIAMWAPNAADGPTVYLNRESPIIEEIVKHHQGNFPLVHAEEVESTVLRVFGEVAACKIAHSQKLTSHLTEQEIDDEYRSESALTTALMGLLAEEALITQRLRHLGKVRGVRTESAAPAVTTA